MIVRFLLIALLLVACDEWTPAPPPEEPSSPPPAVEPDARAGTEVEVLHVVDGDTIRVRFEDRSERVRYIGIDTPEVGHDGAASEPFADAATEANRRLLGDGPVRLVFDVEQRDRYGRLLAYVYAGDAMVNEALLREGWARTLTIPPNVRHAERFTAAQREARDEGRGLWAD